MAEAESTTPIGAINNLNAQQKAPVIPLPPPISPILLPYVQPLGHRMLQLEAIISAKVPKEHLITADFWMHAMQKLQDYTVLHCLWEDGTQYARIMCTHVHGRLSRFVCLEYKRMEELVTTDQSFGVDFKVEQRGTKKWCVVDAHSGEILKDMIATKQQADTDMSDMIKARAR